jgi:site-specific DNA-methyltransferase (adenine-specific)
MEKAKLPIDQIITADCVEIISTLPQDSIDLVFADPPYNLQLQQDLWRPNMTKVEAVDEDWDHFENKKVYDDFTVRWLKACYRVLKPDGSLWVIGTYHNIFRIGSILQDLGYWILNDVIWIKTNPMPNFRGVRLTNAHETLIWACKNKKARYTFNYQSMKAHNDDLQMRSDWFLPICTGPERIKVNGKKAHPTQKPEALLYRVLLASSQPGDIILDPFFGTGTTGAVAKRLHRHFIGIEQNLRYAEIARKRIDDITPGLYDQAIYSSKQPARRAPRLTIGMLLEHGSLKPGQTLFFKGERENSARIKADGQLIFGEAEGSIHQVARRILNGSPCNGWEVWHYEEIDGALHPIGDLREKIRKLLSKGTNYDAVRRDDDNE